MRRPVIGLVQVAPPAAVNQVVQFVRAASRLGLEMIDRERAPAVRFRHTAVLAGAVGALPYLLPQFLGNGHAGCGVDFCASSRCKEAISWRTAAFSAVRGWMRWATLPSWATPPPAWLRSAAIPSRWVASTRMAASS